MRLARPAVVSAGPPFHPWSLALLHQRIDFSFELVSACLGASANGSHVLGVVRELGVVFRQAPSRLHGRGPAVQRATVDEVDGRGGYGKLDREIRGIAA